MHKRIRHVEKCPEIGAFLRSINVQLDAGDAKRIAHFRPTAKAAHLLGKLCLQPAPALLVTAPYGSGKSLTATYALQVIENRSEAKPVLKHLAKELSAVNATLGEFAAKRERSKSRGVTVALQGQVPALREALCDAFAVGMLRQDASTGLAKQLAAHLSRSSSVADTMAFLISLAESAGFDQVFLAWDEFGRHLESLIANGRPSELHDVQQLAELTVRTKRTPLRMCVLLHQGISSYVSAAPDTVRREWRKIEERFERIEYVDDSKELLRLLVDLAASQRRPTKFPDTLAFARYSKALLATGLFKDFRQNELAEVLARVYPLDGVALFLLPRISARVAQNERTLFNFLQSISSTSRIGADDLFRYFEPAMRQDLGVGGTYRAMLETNSASSKCATEAESHALQTACALSISLSANRTKISRSLLALAISGVDGSADDAARLIDGLIERKLLLYRRHSDEVSVWHGTDANLRERIAEVRLAEAGSFDLVRFLEKEWPLPAVRATEHNDKKRMRRFFVRSYRSHAAPDDGLFATPSIDGDGQLVHFLPVGDEKSVATVLASAKAMTKASAGRIIASIPTVAVPLELAALELSAIMHLQKDRVLLDADPLVAEELRQMEDDARAHMLKLVERITNPNDALLFVSSGHEQVFRSTREIRKCVSSACNALYPKTPVLPNEQVNRRRPSAVIVNARKKLIAMVLEASGRADLGFNDPAFQQELGAAVVAQYRAVIKNTGLYRDAGRDRWSFAPPGEIQDPGLSAVWQELRSFYTESSEHPKSLRALLDTLQASPYGVRAGVIPVLIACATRAFPVVGSLTCDGQYVSDIRPTTIEELCKNPERFALTVVAVEDTQRRYLEGVCDLFRGKHITTIDDPDLVRRAFEWIQYWKNEAPEAARVGSVSESAATARKALWSTEDPVRVLLQSLPTALGVRTNQLGEALSRLELVKQELDGVVLVYVKRAVAVMLSAIGESSTECTDSHATTAIRRWAEAIPESALDLVTEPRVKGVVVQLATPCSDAAKLVGMISARLTKAVTRWDDMEVSKFQQEFRRVVELAEEAAFKIAADRSSSDAIPNERLAALVERRIAHHVAMLTKIVGESESKRRLGVTTAHNTTTRRKVRTNG